LWLPRCFGQVAESCKLTVRRVRSDWQRALPEQTRRNLFAISSGAKEVTVFSLHGSPCSEYFLIGIR
jgi:hypothetical protein